jgi:hypothetical protein
MAAVAGVLITAIYAFLTILLWIVTRRQAHLTQQTLETTSRPYLAIGASLMAVARHQILPFNAENRGSFPAVIVDVRADFPGEQLALDETLQPDQPTADRVPFGKLLGVVLPRATEVVAECVVTEFIAKKRPWDSIVAVVTITYEGAYSARYETRSRVFLSFLDSKPHVSGVRSEAAT